MESKASKNEDPGQNFLVRKTEEKVFNAAAG